MNWRLEHHFQELEGLDKRLLASPHAGLWLDSALQTVQFQLCRSGVKSHPVSKGAG